MPVLAAGLLGHGPQELGVQAAAHADDVHGDLLADGVVHHLVGGVLAGVVHAVGEGHHAPGAALEGGVGDTIVDRIVEGSAAAGAHVPDAVEHQVHVVGVIAHLLDDVVKGQDLCPVAHAEVQLADEVGHDALDLAHVAGGDTAALVGGQADVQAGVVLQDEGGLDLTGQEFAPLYSLLDGEAGAVQAAEELAVGIGDLEVDLHLGVFADIGGHQGQAGLLKVGGGVAPLHGVLDPFHFDGQGDRAGFLADEALLGLIGKPDAVVGDHHIRIFHGLALFQQGKVLGSEGKVPVGLQGDGHHGEAVSLHPEDGIRQDQEGQQLLLDLIALLPFRDDDAVEGGLGIPVLAQANIGPSHAQDGVHRVALFIQGGLVVHQSAAVIPRLHGGIGGVHGVPVGAVGQVHADKQGDAGDEGRHGHPQADVQGFQVLLWGLRLLLIALGLLLKELLRDIGDPVILGNILFGRKLGLLLGQFLHHRLLDRLFGGVRDHLGVLQKGGLRHGCAAVGTETGLLGQKASTLGTIHLFSSLFSLSLKDLFAVV